MLIHDPDRPAPPDPRADDAPSASFDGVDLTALAAQLGTPLHAYSASAIRGRIDELLGALDGLDALVCYAAKANTNVAILQLMAARGLGADIVSAGELWRCLQAGIRPERIVFSGVGKTAAEMAEALEAGIGRFNLESRDELETLEQVAFGPYVYHLERGELRQGEEPVHLTDREREMLRILALAPGETVPRSALTGNGTVNERAVDVQINRLRRKIERDPANPLFLQAVRGIGYRLVASP